MSSIYKQAYPKCQHNQKHIAHGVFNKYILDNSWLKRFCEAESVVVFAKPDSKTKNCRFVLIDRKILKHTDLRRKIHKQDNEELKKAKIKFGDIMWSIKDVKKGTYF